VRLPDDESSLYRLAEVASPAMPGICAAIARALGGGAPGGFLVSILLGFVGSFVGTWTARTAHRPEFAIVSISGCIVCWPT
jgi:uncharacterized membrane protein YeaQ/YmgE (transglycosylase-associated protein family)